jgi:hypothetical protein
MSRMALVAGLLVVATGCAAARTQIQILTADQAVGRAADNDAEELAPYQYTLALRYIAKAKEEAGYSNYKDALVLARKAAETADRAVIDIEKSGKKVKVSDKDLDAVPASAAPKPSPPDAPAPDKESP